MSEKIQVKFYALTSEQATRLRKAKLTAAEWRIWSYLVEVDPWGDRYQDISTITVISECSVSKATFYRTIAKFQELGLFDFQDRGFSFKNETGVSKMRLESQKCDSSLKNETGVSKMRLESQKCENQTPEPLPDKVSSAPQTIQTYTDFIQTLSEGERENFEKFVREEWLKTTGREVLSLERFLAKEADLKNWHERFLNSSAGRAAKKKAIATRYDWRTDARFTQWIWEAFNRGYEWVHENEAEREQRLNFYDWAFAVSAFEGVCL